jgi:hypothetical protein
MEHGICCYCRRCKLPHDDCRCDLDDACDENEKLTAEVERLKKLTETTAALWNSEAARVSALEAVVETADQVVCHAYSDCECEVGDDPIKCQGCVHVDEYQSARAVLDDGSK